MDVIVSTHSRTKAAARTKVGGSAHASCFNTQPHEGGCRAWIHSLPNTLCFNTQPHEGGCNLWAVNSQWSNGFNTQPREGGCHCEL